MEHKQKRVCWENFHGILITGTDARAELHRNPLAPFLYFLSIDLMPGAAAATLWM